MECFLTIPWVCFPVSFFFAFSFNGFRSKNKSNRLSIKPSGSFPFMGMFFGFALFYSITASIFDDPSDQYRNFLEKFKFNKERNKVIIRSLFHLFLIVGRVRKHDFFLLSISIFSTFGVGLLFLGVKTGREEML